MKIVKTKRSFRAGNTAGTFGSEKAEEPGAVSAAQHRRCVKIMSRLRNGGYQNALKRSCLLLLKRPSIRHLEYFRTDLMWMFLGDRLMRTYFRDYTVRRVSEYDGTNRLYHFTPTECVDSIRSTGLKPSNRFVYLTDAPDQYKQAFLQWKDKQNGKQSAYVLLEIDAQSLMHEQTIFCTNIEHEFVTGKIDAKYISVVPDGSSNRNLARSMRAEFRNELRLAARELPYGMN